MRHSLAPAAAAPAARAASAPRGGVHPAQEGGGSGDPGRRRTGEPRWTHGPRATRRLSRQGGGGAELRAPAVPGPRPALPFPFSDAKEGSGQGSRGSAGHAGGRLCASGAAWAAGAAGRLPGGAGLSPGAPVAPAAAAQRGTGCSPTPLQGSSADLAATSAFTRLEHALPASAWLAWVGSDFCVIPTPRAPSSARSRPPLPSPRLRQASPGQAGGCPLAASPRPPPALCVQDPGAARREALVDGNSHGHTSACSCRR